MSGYSHRRGRRRGISRSRGYGNEYGQGRREDDAISGWDFPVKDMVKQCGGKVSNFLSDGSLDLKDGRLDSGCPIGRGAPPVLSIAATTDTCIEGTSTGLFTISRTGDTSQALTVYLVISGTATNGTDYTYIVNTIVLPAGSSSVTITVTPTDDGSTEGDETVIIQLDPPVYHSNYYLEFGEDVATVTISDPPAPEGFLLAYEFNYDFDLEEIATLLANSGTGTGFDLEEEVLCTE